MTSCKTDALVLSAAPFQDSHCIATLFTPDLGICKVLGLYSRLPKNLLFGCLTPLNHIEVSLCPSKNDLYKIESGSILDGHGDLRKDFNRLNAACQMLKCTGDSQWPHKPAPLLFKLLKSYLELMQSADPDTILASFQLKILRHEGLLAISDACAFCGNEPKQINIEEGKTQCISHAKNPAFSLDEEETAYFYAIGLATSIELLANLKIPPSLAPKVLRLFNTQILS